MIAAALLLAAAPAVASPGVASFGRDIVISQPVAGRVVAVLSDVQIDAPVSGDVIVWGGDVSFGPSGEVRSNLSVFGGDVVRASGRLPVRGTVSTPGTLLRFYLDEMQRAPWQTGEKPATLTGLRLIMLAFWLALGLLLLYMFGSPFARAAASAESNWTAAMIAGVLGVLALFVTAASALAILPASISVPIVLLVALLGVAAKVFGMAALFLLLGQKIMRRFAPARRPSDLAIGFLLLGAISLVPLVGGVVWSAASVVAVGIALTSRFGTPRFRVPFA